MANNSNKVSGNNNNLATNSSKDLGNMANSKVLDNSKGSNNNNPNTKDISNNRVSNNKDISNKDINNNQVSSNKDINNNQVSSNKDTSNKDINNNKDISNKASSNTARNSSKGLAKDMDLGHNRHNSSLHYLEEAGSNQQGTTALSMGSSKPNSRTWRVNGVMPNSVSQLKVLLETTMEDLR